MSAAPGSAWVRGFEAVEVISAIPSTFAPTTTSRPVGRPVVRFPEQLRIHRALEDLGLVGVVDEINEAARLKDKPVPEPILITPTGTILAGFGGWRLAQFEGRREIDCIEYTLGEDEALPFILTHHRPRRGWNPFVRIRLANTGARSSAEGARQHACGRHV